MAAEYLLMCREVPTHWCITGTGAPFGKRGSMAVRVCKHHPVWCFTDILSDSSTSSLLWPHTRL